MNNKSRTTTKATRRSKRGVLSLARQAIRRADVPSGDQSNLGMVFYQEIERANQARLRKDVIVGSRDRRLSGKARVNARRAA